MNAVLRLNSFTPLPSSCGVRMVALMSIVRMDRSAAIPKQTHSGLTKVPAGHRWS